MVLVIGIGNLFRRDDGAGLLAAQRVAALHLPGVRVLEQSGEGAALLEAWQGARQVLLLDAVQSVPRQAPGTIHRLDTRQPLPAALVMRSSHDFGAGQAIETARALDLLPAHLFIIGIEGKDFSYGPGLSPEVAGAFETYLSVIVQEIQTPQVQVERTKEHL